MNINIPADIPQEMRPVYEENYRLITHDTGRLMLFAGDQKIEHMNDDYFGEGISEENNNPLHMFQIASKAKIGVFASQLGLLAKYGADFPDIPYLVKLNSKTNLTNTKQTDPVSKDLWYMQEVIEFKKNSGLKITAVGYTIYFGSEYETEMLQEAAQIIYQAHQNGLLSVIWAYPRGKAVTNEKDPHIIAGAAGAVAALGADFVKVNPPQKEGIDSAELLQEAVQAAGRTQVVCAGGSSMDVQTFLTTLYKQIHIAGSAGNATGRNIHQKSLEEAVKFCNAIFAVTVEDKSVEEAMKIYSG